jgi:riboflavin kinase/FMN adenylyltransferase
MQVTRLPDATPRPRRIAIGTFDGVHVGHRAVIAGADTVLTFEPHPLRILSPEAAPKLILPFEIKRDVIAGLGVEEMVVIPFDRDFTLISAEDFVRGILIERLDAREVSVGQNFRFGARARGDAAMLAAQDEFTTRVVPLVTVDGETVSSTRIRALIAAGDVAAAGRCLGAPVMLEGEVVRGDSRGRELGFPTANIVPDESLVVPGHGVYAGFANDACALACGSRAPAYWRHGMTAWPVTGASHRWQRGLLSMFRGLLQHREPKVTGPRKSHGQPTETRWHLSAREKVDFSESNAQLARELGVTAEGGRLSAEEAENDDENTPTGTVLRWPAASYPYISVPSVDVPSLYVSPDRREQLTGGECGFGSGRRLYDRGDNRLDWRRRRHKGDIELSFVMTSRTDNCCAGA